MARRALHLSVSSCRLKIAVHTDRLLAREASSDTSLPFPFAEVASRVRLAGTDEDVAWSAELRSFSFSFCLAAFTLALERKTLASVEDPGTDVDGSSRCGVDGLQLLVASGCWV